MAFECSMVIKVPMLTEEMANVAKMALEVDREAKLEKAQKTITVQDETLVW